MALHWSHARDYYKYLCSGYLKVAYLLDKTVYLTWLGLVFLQLWNKVKIISLSLCLLTLYNYNLQS